ncbi:MAG: hypothetical protein GY705_31320 [Bacteroidetes bacterium]|nr:hypothetical protein [Bacteroidota bacterium]
MRYITYNKRHRNVVEEGFESLVSYYESNDSEGKMSILLCLDVFLDPYYRNYLPYEDKIYSWLEKELFKTTNDDIREDILDLLSYGQCETFDLLAKNIGKLSRDLLLS